MCDCDRWRGIETAPACEGNDTREPESNGRHPVLVTRFPFNGHHAPMAVARLTKRGWINGLKTNRLWFEPTHWQPLPAAPVSDGSSQEEG